MTAVLEIVALDVAVPPTDVATAPIGRRGAAGLVFCATLRRIGANARLADQPEGGGRATEEHGRRLCE